MNKLKKNKYHWDSDADRDRKKSKWKHLTDFYRQLWIFDVFRLLKIADVYKFISPFYQLNNMNDAL